MHGNLATAASRYARKPARSARAHRLQQLLIFVVQRPPKAKARPSSSCKQAVKLQATLIPACCPLPLLGRTSRLGLLLLLLLPVQHHNRRSAYDNPSNGAQVQRFESGLNGLLPSCICAAPRCC